MSVIDDVRADREDLARVLKKHAGIRRIVEDLYPDRAHFIYELLQNAEDAGARKAMFVLAADGLAFEHEGGRPFEPRDVAGITDIGEDTKAGDEEKIGRFGVGFKAVFAYSETPSIWSPTLCFKITDLVLPYEIPCRPGLGKKTRFEFPFNNQKKKADVAEAEIRAGLEELAETTLLFLSNLESVTWTYGAGASGEVSRIVHSDHHVEGLRQNKGRTDRSHFLIFKAPVAELPRQSVGVAFSLEALPGRELFASDLALHEQMRVAAAQPGRVAVYFPAAKETSGLRFNVHAPFVPELSRASVKEAPLNAPLFEQLGALTARALHQIKDCGLLTLDCLSVLPNDQDELAPRYEGIRKAVIEEMNETPLTPTAARASRLPSICSRAEQCSGTYCRPKTLSTWLTTRMSRRSGRSMHRKRTADPTGFCPAWQFVAGTSMSSSL